MFPLSRSILSADWKGCFRWLEALFPLSRSKEMSAPKFAFVLANTYLYRRYSRSTKQINIKLFI